MTYSDQVRKGNPEHTLIATSCTFAKIDQAPHLPQHSTLNLLDTVGGVLYNKLNASLRPRMHIEWQHI